jgi:hypothetical protein
LSRSSVLGRKREDTLGLEVELDLEAALTTVYCLGLQWWRPVVDGDVVVVELPAAVRARELDPILGICASYRALATGAHYQEE